MKSNGFQIERDNVEEILALTPLQEGMLYHYMSSPNEHIYENQIVLRISGKLDTERFKSAWVKLIERNEMLRTIFKWKRISRPVQIVLKSKDSPFYEYRFSGGSREQQNEWGEEILLEDRGKVHDLSSEPFRILLLRYSNEQYAIVVSYHHILFDGWSSSIMLKELFAHYVNMEQEATFRKSQFKTYLKWNKDREKTSDMLFWQKYLKDFDEKTKFPTMQLENVVGSTDRYSFSLPSPLLNKLEELARNLGITTAVLFYWAWGVLLQSYSLTDDVVFGTTISGRTPQISGIEDMVGLFINTIPLRAVRMRNETVREALIRLHAELMERNDHAYLPLIDIKKQSQVNKRENLFDTNVVIENYPLEYGLINNKIENIKIDSVSSYETTSFEVNLSVSLYDGKLNISYDSCKYGYDQVVRMGNHLTNLLVQVVERCNETTEKVELISDEEKKQLLIDFNKTEATYPLETIHGMFEARVAMNPTNVAVMTTKEKLTYASLNQRANQLARTLRKKGVVAGTVVALMCERSADILVGLFAILKSGGAYLPINPKDPLNRKQALLDDSDAKILLMSNQLQEINDYDGQVIVLEDPSLMKESVENLLPTSSPNDIAYIIYTSGSTGKPKGVMIEHHSVVNRLHWMQKTFPLSSDDVILQKTPYTFDVSVWEFFWWSFYGARVYLLSPDEEKNPERISAAIKNGKVTVMHFVPSMLGAFLLYLENKRKELACLSSLKQVFTSGEALHVEHVKNFNQLIGKRFETVLINLYGPTEATVDVSYYPCSELPRSAQSVPIGKPIDNIHLYILNQWGALQPIGVPGELYIAGAGVARGYLNRLGLTRERFVDNPYITYSKMYRTGDLVKWNDYGSVDYINRIDHQVKIRGYRIELGEIENCILRLKEVKDAVVVPKVHGHGESYLVAYIVANSPIEPDIVKEELKQELPNYMIPAQVIKLEVIPTTPNGKVDRSALINLDDLVSTGNLLNTVEIPENSIQEQLVLVWEQLLSTKVGVQDHFFDMGGNSLLLIQLHVKLDKIYPEIFTMVDLFSNPTISDQARFIENSERKKKVLKTIESIDLPKEYILNDSRYAVLRKTITFEVEQQSYEKLSLMSKNYSMEIAEILVSFFMYTLYRTSLASKLGIYTMLHRKGEIKPLLGFFAEINQDIDKLFSSVREQLRKDGSTISFQEELKHTTFKDVIGTVVLFGRQDLFTHDIEGSNLFDMIVYVDLGDRLNISCAFNNKRIDSSKMEQLFLRYANVLKLVAQQYEVM